MRDRGSQPSTLESFWGVKIWGFTLSLWSTQVFHTVAKMGLMDFPAVLPAIPILLWCIRCGPKVRQKLSCSEGHTTPGTVTEDIWCNSGHSEEISFRALVVVALSTTTYPHGISEVPSSAILLTCSHQGGSNHAIWAGTLISI